MGNEEERHKVSNHEMTPRARKYLRMGLALVKLEYTKALKAAGKLEDDSMTESGTKAKEYVTSLAHEFAEPGSAEAEDQAQAHLFGDEGPFREDLHDMKGRP